MRKLRINGRRGAFQLLFATIHFIVGASFLLIPAAPSRQAALQYLVDLNIPLAPFAALWILSGALATVSAFKCRPADWFGFAALVVAPSVWGVLFLAGVVFASAPPLGVLTAAIYWVFGATSMIVSGMQGQNDRDRRERQT